MGACTYNHTGQVVTDLQRSKRFYNEVFGFQLWYEITPPDEAIAKLTSLCLLYTSRCV